MKSILIRTALIAIVLLPFLVTAVILLTGRDNGGNNALPGPEAKPAGNGGIPLRTGETPVLTEFGDFQCIHCARFALGIMQEIDRDLVRTGRLEFEYRHYPFLGPESLLAAEAAECARDQGRFPEYHDALYLLTLERRPLTSEALARAAGETGLDRARFQECTQAGAHRERVREDKEYGRSLGVRGTPTLFLDGQPLEWRDYRDLRDRIDARLAEYGKPGQ